MNFVYFLGWSFFRAVYATYFRWRVFNAEKFRAKAVKRNRRIYDLRLMIYDLPRTSPVNQIINRKS